MECKYKTFGVLYNYEAAEKACPPGWHLPTDDEWQILEYFMGMDKKDLSKTKGRGNLGRLLRSKELWLSKYKEADKFGLSALPAGYFIYDLNQFYDLGKGCAFWAYENAKKAVWRRSIKYQSKKIERDYSPRANGYSVRCIKD